MSRLNGTPRVGFLTTHPIQYHAPWFRAITSAAAMDLEVLYCRDAAPDEQAGAGFGVSFAWDVPLLDGYKYRFLPNVSKRPSIGSFGGLDTPELRTLIHRHRYDAVVINGWHYKSAWQAIWACWRAHVPVMVRSDSHLHTPRHPLKKMLKAAPYHWFVPRLDACLSVGQWSSDYFLHYGARRDRVFVVPHAVSPAFASGAAQLAPRRDQFRARWGFRPEQTVFLFVGKLIQKKRPTDFIQAIQQANRVNPNIAGLIVGDGPLRQACGQLAVKAPVKFAGFLNQSEIVQAYVAADALVLPSDGEETWGVVVNEAMTCARACVVSDRVGCGPDLVTTEETGFVFPLGDVTGLTSHIVRCASHSGRLLEMGEQARARMAGYSVVAAASHLMRAVEAVAA